MSAGANRQIGNAMSILINRGSISCHRWKIVPQHGPLYLKLRLRRSFLVFTELVEIYSRLNHMILIVCGKRHVNLLLQDFDP
jgi:hypothetical protein